MKYFYIILIVFVITAPDGCKSSDLPPDAYIKWVEDDVNGLKISKTMGLFTFTLQYKPYEYIALKELGIKNPDEVKLKETKKRLKGHQYFDLRISTSEPGITPLYYGVNNEEQFNERLHYFLFKAQLDFYLLDGEDSLICELYHFERNFGLAPYKTILTGFSHPKGENSSYYKDNKTFVYNDKVLGIGPVMLKISANALNNIPALKLDSTLK